MFILDTPGSLDIRVIQQTPYTHAKINYKMLEPDQEPPDGAPPDIGRLSNGAIGYPTIDVHVRIGTVDRSDNFTSMEEFTREIPHPDASSIRDRSAGTDDSRTAMEKGIFAWLVINEPKITAGQVI